MRFPADRARRDDAVQTDVDPALAAGKQQRRVCKIAAYWLTASMAMAPFQDMIADVSGLHAPTPQEQTIADAMDTAFSTSGVQVRCVPLDYLRHLSPFFPKGIDELGVGEPYSHTVWLQQKICDELTTFKDHPIRTAQELLSADLPKARNDQILDATEGVRVAAHEGGHAILNDAREPDAECYAFQVSTALALALGGLPANAAVEQAWRHNVIGYEEDDHRGILPNQYSFELSLCRDGGLLDLQPTVPGEFPTQR